MAKILKNVFISICGMFAILFAGFFFVGCGVDYDLITLVSDVKSIELEVGESVDVYFTIDNYQKGFENKVSINAYSNQDGSEQVDRFKCSDLTYVGDDRIKVKVTGVAGGQGTIYAKTLEGDKSCSVSVNVKQYSKTMQSNNSLLYVSNSNDFVPTDSLFAFDSHTTYKEMSYYYFEQKSDFNFNTYYVSSINEESGIATFTDGIGGSAEGIIKRIDSVKLTEEDGGNKIVLVNGQEETKIDFVSKFYLFSVYDYSVNNEDYEKILFDISSVNVLPSLDVSVYGGYLIDNSVDFEEWSADSIVIVPNNSKMANYILKFEVSSALDNSSLVDITKRLDFDYLDVDFYDYEEVQNQTKKVFYVKVSHSAKVQCSTTFGFDIFYLLAQNIDDDDVNVSLDFTGEIKVAPKSLSVNGTSEPETIRVYSNNFSTYGYQDLNISVQSDFGVEADYDGVYFTYDPSLLDFMNANGVTVRNGDLGDPYDLSGTFRVRGKSGGQGQNTDIVVHLKSDILPDSDEITLTINFEIVEGASAIITETQYQGGSLYFDYDGGKKRVQNIFYTTTAFNSISFEHQGGPDNVGLSVGRDENQVVTPYIYDELTGKYYLNFDVTPKSGSVDSNNTGIYKIYLDNGTNAEIPFTVLKVLSEKTTTLALADEGNGAVTSAVFEDENGTGFNNVLKLEILNESSKDEVVFGSSASVLLNANVKASGIQVDIDNDCITVLKINGGYKFVTTKNGEAVVTLKLKGNCVNEEFKLDIAEVELRIEISSYSLISEFYVLNGLSFANENEVFYGATASVDEKSLKFDTVVNNKDSYNFYKFELTLDTVIDIFKNGETVEENEGFAYSVKSTGLQKNLVKSSFDNKFVYYYAESRGKAVVTSTVVTISSQGVVKNINLSFSNGLMFVGEDKIYYEVDEEGNTLETYEIEFSNVYKMGSRYGEFSTKTLTYSVVEDASSNYACTIIANVEQRKLSRKYNINISPTEFLSVGGISLASSSAKLNFSSKQLKYTIGLYTYPVYATNKKINIEFVATNGNKYSDLLTYPKNADSSDGIYTITLSCEEFFRKNQNKIVDIDCPLTGVVYIYPSEWASSYTSVKDREIIAIEIQYRNGSKANPYLVESADDIIDINKNATMLSSHYEISSVVDMSKVENFTPIGILNDELVGFSGTIVGSSSQSSVTNISVSDTNFVAEVSGCGYYGLFAKVNDGAVIENVSFEGSFGLNASKESYVGLAASINAGDLINVGATIKKSAIDVSLVDGDIYIGGLVGKNDGYIVQDFKKYANEQQVTEADSQYNHYGYNSGYLFKKLTKAGTDDRGDYADVDSEKIYIDSEGYEINELGQRVIYEKVEVLVDGKNDIVWRALPNQWYYQGQNSKNLAFFKDFLTITMQGYAKVFAGGIAGVTTNVVQRTTAVNIDFKLYGYSAYSAYTLIAVNGEYGEAGIGGAIGKMDSNVTDASISNLLIGGEVSTANSTPRTADYVGGIVGFVEEKDSIILGNVARTFVRGLNYVGGIAGYENYVSDKYVDWADGNFTILNVVESVDDGRTAFYASQIIRFTKPDSKKSESVGDSYFAIGGGGSGVRTYDDRCFKAISYLNRQQISTTLVDINNNATTSFYGDCVEVDLSSKEYNGYKFTHQNVNLGVSGHNVLTSEESGENVYFMYYFEVKGMQNGKTDFDRYEAVEALNYVSPNNSQMYPFKLSSTDVSIESIDSNVISIDSNGFMTVKSVGLAVITLSSVLNININKKLYIYAVNYFDKNVTSSIIYTSQTSNGVVVKDGSLVNVYGTSNTSIYVVPSYKLEESKTVDGEDYSVDSNGILHFLGVSYILQDSLYVTADVNKTENTEDKEVSSVYVGKQTIIFSKGIDAESGDTDKYEVVPILEVKVLIDGEEYSYFYKLERAKINLEVIYKEVATAIQPTSHFFSIQTNQPFADSVRVESENENEKLFYRIYKVEDDGSYSVEPIQDKMPNSLAEVDSYDVEIGTDDLFDLEFTKRPGANIFDYVCKVNQNSDAFKNRFNVGIYGKYVVMLYASQLVDGVCSQFEFVLEEASVNYVSINNYSSSKNISSSDEVIVPGQEGMLEILIDPVEAVFDTITISNKPENSNEGAGISDFTFVYEMTENEGVSYVKSYSFATTKDGKMTFSYKDLVNFLTSLNNQQSSVQEETAQGGKTPVVDYKGKIYIAYFMPSINVEDGVSVGFDVEVVFGGQIKEIASSSIWLTTKLDNYAKLSFKDREPLGNDYYVAKGLSYEMNLDSYGFSRDQISVSTTDETVAKVSYVDGKYVLNVADVTVSYSAGQPGYKVDILTTARKILDGNQITTTDTISVYVMEYVVNYAYIEGVNEDIVKGMSNGVIRNAIGNPRKLEIDTTKFIEYNPSNATIKTEVENFVSSLTNNVVWKVYYNNTAEVLQTGKTMRTDYYLIDGKTVTPLKVYNAISKVYHFSVGTKYAMASGMYSISSNPGAYDLYTEFDFEVYDQSTEESPIPVETYQDFLNMEDGQWYILLNDIVLPSKEYVEANSSLTEFQPISKNIGGLDGNGYSFIFEGTYDFETSEIGVFGSVGDETILKNITVLVASDTVFNVTSTSFVVGLVASSNNGVMTNCATKSVSGARLSVVASGSSCYVAGLVGENSGFITNSRSQVNIIANVNISGFVGQNTGTIASSYFMGASLQNETETTADYTAGFAITNNGEIFTSYVSGNPLESAGKAYYDGENNIITSNFTTAGFVYSNSGIVEDCYSNIRLYLKKDDKEYGSGSISSGFVFANSGAIERCFSTSLLKSENSASYGFAYKNNLNSITGSISECCYLQQEQTEDFDGVNESIGVLSDANAKITNLNIDGFRNLANFKNFVVSENRDISSVWFYNDGSNFDYFNASTFNTGRIELVAPNIVAKSKRKLDHIENVVDIETGASYAEYVYVYTEDSESEGSIYNPIVVYDCESFENYIAKGSDSLNFNENHYRIVCDIDYGDYEYISGLYKTRFVGYMEGNFMTVSGMTVSSDENLTCAGLFAEIGYGGFENSIGSILNVTFKPIVVSFTNARAVGGLAGRLDGGTLANVSIEVENDKVVVVGNNMVGGLVGVAIGDYKLQNVSSQLSVRASKQSVQISNNFSEDSTDYSGYSFAGAVAGVLSGSGKIFNLVVNTSVDVLGDKAGVAVGFVDSNVLLEKVLVDMSSGNRVNAYSYGGLVVGQSQGTLVDIIVKGSGVFGDFVKSPSIPKAVGGVVGLATGGSLSQIDMSQSIQVISRDTDTEGIESLGGVIGMMSNNTALSSITVRGSFDGFKYVGGIVGSVDLESGSVYIKDIDVECSLKVSGRELTEIGVGGVVGMLGDNSTLDIRVIPDAGNPNKKNTVVVKNIDVTSYVYGKSVSVFAGAIFGALAGYAQFVYNTSSMIEAGNVLVVDMDSDAPIENDEPINTNIGGIGCESTCGDITFRCSKNDDGSATDGSYSLTIYSCS